MATPIAAPTSTSKGWSTPRYIRDPATIATASDAEPLRHVANMSRHREHVDEADHREREDRNRRRRQRVPLPATDGRDVVGTWPPVAVDQIAPDHVQHEEQAEEGEQVAPPTEHDGDDDQGDGDEEHRPARRDAIGRAGHRRQPACAPSGQCPQDRRVDLVGAATGPKRRGRHDHPHDQHDDRDDPPPTRSAKAARQWRRCTGGAPHAPRASHGRRNVGGAVEQCVARVDHGIRVGAGGHVPT